MHICCGLEKMREGKCCVLILGGGAWLLEKLQNGVENGVCIDTQW